MFSWVVTKTDTWIRILIADWFLLFAHMVNLSSSNDDETWIVEGSLSCYDPSEVSEVCCELIKMQPSEFMRFSALTCPLSTLQQLRPQVEQKLK